MTDEKEAKGLYLTECGVTGHFVLVAVSETGTKRTSLGMFSTGWDPDLTHGVSEAEAERVRKERREKA